MRRRRWPAALALLALASAQHAVRTIADDDDYDENTEAPAQPPSFPPHAPITAIEMCTDVNLGVGHGGKNHMGGRKYCCAPCEAHHGEPDAEMRICCPTMNLTAGQPVCPRLNRPCHLYRLLMGLIASCAAD